MHTLLMVGNQGLGKSLTDGVDLSNVTSALDTDADVNRCKTGMSEKEDGLKNLEPKNLGFNKLNRAAVNLNKTTASLAVGNSNSTSLH